MSSDKAELFLETVNDMSEGKALKADGFDEAIIGIMEESRGNHFEFPVLVYSKKKMIEICMKNDDMNFEDAVEFLEFNTWQAWMGEGTPIYIADLTLEDVSQSNS